MSEAAKYDDEPGVPQDPKVKVKVRKEHRCKYCRKVFATRWKLGRHIRHHTQEKPFACPFCPLKFSDNSSLLTHQRNFKHNDWSFECQWCRKRFSTEKGLRRHKDPSCDKYYMQNMNNPSY